jgi:hypothetical protein
MKTIRTLSLALISLTLGLSATASRADEASQAASDTTRQQVVAEYKRAQAAGELEYSYQFLADLHTGSIKAAQGRADDKRDANTTRTASSR